MSTLHPLSHGTPLSEFDIFSVPPTQLSVVNDLETEHRPIQPMSADRLAQFEFSTAPNEYVKWTDTELYVKMRIKVTTSPPAEIKLADWKNLSLSENFMHTMIQSLDLSINGRVITKSSITYPYRAFFDHLIGYSPDAKHGHLSSVMYNGADEKRDSSRFMPLSDAVAQSYGEYFELRGRLCFDLAQQARAMIGGCTYKLEIRFNKPEFVFQKKAEWKASVDWDIANLTLIIHRSVVSGGTLTAHTKALSHATAKYPITRHEVQTVTVSPGLLDVTLDRIFTGQLPRRVLVAFVKAAAFRGSFDEEPFYFDHFNINHLSFNIDGQAYPRSPFQPNFSSKLYMREYYSFLQTFNQDSIDPNLQLDYHDYLNGHTYFCYNFAPDLGDGCGFGGYLSLIKRGTLGLHLRFSRPPAEPFTAIIFAEFDNLIEIDKDRQVTTDYII